MIKLIDHPGDNKDPGCYKIDDYDPYLTVDISINDIKIYSDGHLCGGGSGYGQEIIPVIKHLYPNRVFDHGLEWCSGSGYMGFGLLAKDVVKNLCLSDVFRPAIVSCQETIKNLPEKYHDREIRTLHTGDVNAFPDELVFDLIIANPPHWDWTVKPFREAFNDPRICADDGWKIHENFFQNIKKHLREDGVILLQESASASGPETFVKMVRDNGLKIHRSFQTAQNLEYWYLEVHHA